MRITIPIGSRRPRGELKVHEHIQEGGGRVSYGRGMRFALVGLLAGVLGCGAPTAPPTTPAVPPGARVTHAALSAPIDEKAVASATGADNPESSGGVVKVSFPRRDVDVKVDGWKMPPFMGLTSWAAFSPGREGVAQAMVMGDLVLFEDEVSAVMSVLFAAGVDVTALHNHFFYDTPRVYFMHIGGEGTVAALGAGVRRALETAADIRKKAPRPASTFGAPPPGGESRIDGARLEALFGMKGQAKDGMWKLVVGREATASCGCSVGKVMGVNTWAAFAGTDEDAIVDGDFAMTETELQPVLRELRAGGINVVAIHHHMSGESPRILFAHYWGRGKAVDLAAVLARALQKTAYEGRVSKT
jgi:Domain of Unknown Function (DUF1259)